MSPQRIQRKRTKGWRKPTGAIYVGRGSKWGSPFAIGHAQVRTPAISGEAWEHEGRSGKTSGEKHAFFHPSPEGEPLPITWHQVEDATAEQCVQMYRERLTGRDMVHIAYRHTSSMDVLLAQTSELAGHDLMCWCPLDQPCHADVLLELANSTDLHNTALADTDGQALVQDVLPRKRGG